MLFLFTPGAVLALASLSVTFGFSLDWSRLVVLTFLSVTVGLAIGAIFGVYFGVLAGVCGGVPVAVFLSMTGGGNSVFDAAYVGLFGGFWLSAASGWITGALHGPVRALTLGSILAAVAGGGTGLLIDLTTGLQFGLAILVGYLRLPVYAVEIVVQAAVWLVRTATGRNTLRWAPVLYHEFSYLPHPLLENHLMAERLHDANLSVRVMLACLATPGQRRTGLKISVRNVADVLLVYVWERQFDQIRDLRPTGLPGLHRADAVIQTFADAGRYAVAANAAFSPHHRLRHLRGLEAELNKIERQIHAGRDVFTLPFEAPLIALRRVAREQQADAEREAAGLLPNPFRAGNPLSDEEGPELFRGREQALRDIEEILSDPTRAASLQLLAPRRSGKTSLLKMLPSLLPDAICVFFDLQAHPVTSAGAFWSKLAEQAALQARHYHRVDLPVLPEGPPNEAAAAWIEELDRLCSNRRVLLCIDEFERLEDLFPGSRRDFLQLMGLIRATIQHRRGVRILVSGAATFDDLDRVWEDHFIGVRQIKLPFLDLAASVGLLARPEPDFPDDAIPEEVAREVYRRTAGQPFLLQVFGSLLVSHLNEDKRREATLADVQAIEARAIEWAGSYFGDMYKSAPKAAQIALGALAQDRTADLSPPVRPWLAQRYLLTAENRLAIPLFGAWIEHHALV
jgi:hypothetical protein